ncbi:MAG: hypothetical protein ISP90_05260 [Nevskia sp.]|nr:hypothetical protein [Nevskia sp.]
MRHPQRLRGARLAPVLALFLLLPAVAGAATPAGTVTLLTGRGTATGTDGSIRAMAKGDPVYSGDMVHTGAASYIDLKFSDGGFFLLRPNTRFQVVDYVDKTGGAAAPAAPAAPKPAAPVAAQPQPAPLVSTAPQAGASHAFFRLLKGGFRSVSGLIGKINHDDYQVATPVATVGIRGTDYLAVICDSTCATDPVIAAALPPGASALGGLVTSVYSDSIVVTTDKGSVTVERFQYVLVLADGTVIRLPGEPHFLHIDPVPNPTQCGG